MLLPLLIIGLVFLPSEPVQAARGGRVGGGSFRSTTPSIPRSRGYGGGTYRGGYGGYRGGGIGFPFLLPFFGFGGGGLFGFLILMTIAGVIVNSIRGSASSIGGSNLLNQTQTTQSPVTIAQLQLGLLASAKSIQEELRGIAKNADTSTPKGLQIVLQETSLSLLRQQDLCVYANSESGSIPFNSAENTFNKLSMAERSKLTSEITSNFGGKLKENKIVTSQSGEADLANEYIAITIIIATTAKLLINDSKTSEELVETLRILGSIASSELIALEVIWQPEGKGDVLTAEELVTSYPNLNHL